MTLVGRYDLISKANKDLNVHEQSCQSTTCDYLDHLKEELRYSILSHRWGVGEVVFGDILKLSVELAKMEELPSTEEQATMLRNLIGWEAADSIDKLTNFLELSAKKNCKYAWADTVCIYKDSSSELDESIRSMFSWYQDSQVCIVYLGDTDLRSDLTKDRWFTRGWTLQELLAPRCLAFYSMKWQQLTRNDCIKRSVEHADQPEDEGKLWSHIAKITGIDAEDLHNFKPGLYDIRKRLTWVSKRRTTRMEDMAYCLIGIFDVNLPIAYGEREKSFYRLQVEILQNSDDMTLFDWQGEASIYSSMLAGSPACFSNSLDLRTDKSLRINEDSICEQTNVGIRMPPPLYQINQRGAQQSWELPDGAIAFSVLGASPIPNNYAILLLGVGDRPGQYKRLTLVEKELNLDSYKQINDVVFIK